MENGQSHPAHSLPEAFTVLAIESSCDETAVAIMQNRPGEAPLLKASVISSQIDIHKEYGGVIPELASRNHSADLPRLIREACAHADQQVKDIDVFAATSGPGLVAALLVGNTTAKALAVTLNKPFISVNHLEGHLLSPFIPLDEGPPPHLGVVVSGGHTLFIHVKDINEYELLGRSLDDAAGEAFDKVAKMLGLPYPGGPEIDKRARLGNPQAFTFPRALAKDRSLNVSFSGLKTAVLYTLPKLAEHGNPTLLPESTINDLCASFQQAVIDILISKTLDAAKSCRQTTIALSGGVACNSALREQLTEACRQCNLRLILPDPKFTTDNAAMIAFTALHKAKHGLFSCPEDEVNPNLRLTDSQNRSQQDTPPK